MFKFFGGSIVKKIFIALLVFEIAIISYISIFTYPKIEESNRIYTESSLNKLLDEKRKNAEYLFEQVEHETMNLGLWVSEVLNRNITVEELYSFYDDYFINDNNIITNHFDIGDDVSNIFFSYDGKISNNQISDILNTARLEEQFRMSKNRLHFSEWIYFITDYNMIRTYPGSKENVENFPYNHNFKRDIYYSVANEENNPEKKPIWTNPYWDYLGKGLVITCTYPIYDSSEKMIGIICIDVGLQGLQKSISDLSIEGKGVSFLVDKDGKIIYYPDYQLDETERGYVVKDNINIFAESKEEEVAYENMLAKKEGIQIIDSGRKQDILLFDTIPKLDWIIGIQVNRHEFYTEGDFFYGELMSLMILSVLLMIFILLYFYKVLSIPLFNLVSNIQSMGEKYISEHFALTDSKNEIIIVNNAFESVKNKLDNYIEQLNFKNDKLNTIFDNMPEMLYIIDDSYNLLSYNKNVKNLINDENFNLSNRKCFNSLYNKNKACAQCPVKQSLSEYRGVLSEVHINGRICNISSFPIFNSYNLIKEIIVFGVDKTDEMVRTMELANAEKFAMIGELSASVTHQLKNNISVIRGASYLLNDIQSKGDFDIDEITEIITSLSSSIKDAEDIVTSLLGFNTNGDNLSKIDVIKVIEQISIIEKNNLYKNQICIDKHYEEHEIFIVTRENSLKYILANLIRNSIESMKYKGGTLTLRVFKIDGHLHIEVIDTGNGLDEGIKHDIFEPFFTTKKKGSGLGLWIAKKQVKKLNGQISCESKKGLGTKFVVVLPMNKGGI